MDTKNEATASSGDQTLDQSHGSGSIELLGADQPLAVPSTPVTGLMSDTGYRRSARSIKRKKFDDEVVESSLTPSQPKIEKLIKAKAVVPMPEVKPSPTPSTSSSTTLTASTPFTPLSTPSEIPTTPSTTAMSTPSTDTPRKEKISPVAVTITPIVTPPPVTTVAPPPEKVEKKKTKTKNRNKKASKAPAAASTKDLGRWKPQDDLLLINAIQQTCDLTAVYLGCKFSCRFTLREIQERWYALLYDPILSKLAVQAMKHLHPDVIAQADANALFSRQEETLLATIPSNHFQNNQPNTEAFETLLRENPSLFHPARTPKHVMNHWLLMKQYHLLPDQSVQPMPKGDHVLNFSDAEDLVTDAELTDVKDDCLEHELSVADRRNKKEIRHLENELPKWQVLVDSVTGISPQEFDTQTLAVLRGRLVRYLMRSKEITLGRITKDNSIDVDLSLEGPAWKISRRQGIIKLKNNGEFYLANEGKRPVYIDGKPVMCGNKHKLINNSVVEISCLRFIFLINEDLVSMLRQGAQESPKIQT